ncbi:MAG: hypothetical protein IT514_04215 [Burkholderiales bacterium]|nr:hypothetical protein [Burkholderiales bacterium]
MLAIVTSAFVRLAATTAASQGLPGLRIVEVAHPVGGIPIEEVRAKARAAADLTLAGGRALGACEARSSTGCSALRICGPATEVTAAFYRRGWTDGLPIVPPTVEAVREMLAGTDLAPDHALGAMAPGNAPVTVEKIAVNAVMAGCRPIYLPVIIAAIEGLLEPDFDLTGVQCSTGAHSPLLLVNGPVRAQINLNCASGALGPGWQANATIGRAVRLIQNNVGGAKIGVTDMTTLGMAENYTYCMGENEERNPWTPFHLEQGFARHESTVSVLGAFSPEHISDHVGIRPQEILAVAADTIARLARFHLRAMDHIIPRETFLVLGPEHARSIADAGWSKSDVQHFVAAQASIPYTRLKSLGRRVDEKKLVPGADGPRVPMFANPGCLKVIVAGGPGKHSVYINSGHTRRIITRKIAFPRAWERLLERYGE